MNTSFPSTNDLTTLSLTLTSPSKVPRSWTDSRFIPIGTHFGPYFGPHGSARYPPRRGGCVPEGGWERDYLLVGKESAVGRTK